MYFKGCCVLFDWCSDLLLIFQMCMYKMLVNFFVRKSEKIGSYLLVNIVYISNPSNCRPIFFYSTKYKYTAQRIKHCRLNQATTSKMGRTVMCIKPVCVFFFKFNISYQNLNHQSIIISIT